MPIHLGLIPFSFPIQLSYSCQIRSPRVGPHLISHHLRLLVKIEHIRKRLVPRVTRGCPRELRLPLHCNLPRFDVHDILRETHVLVRQVLCEELKVRLYATDADEAASEEGGEEGFPVLDGRRLDRAGEVRNKTCDILLRGKVIA